MVPANYREFFTTLKSLVEAGEDPLSRIDDAVLRILRVKEQLGLFDKPMQYHDVEREARDLRVDVNAWLLHADTVTRVDFGSPRSQADYSLDPPPDAAVRPRLDYRILDGATVGDREFLYVYDAANARLIGFQRADGAFVRQWLAADGGEWLTDLRALSVTSVADGPPIAYLLTADGVLRLVLE